MDNSSYHGSERNAAPPAVKKNVSLPDCPVYKFTFPLDLRERNKLPYPEICMEDFFQKRTMTDVAREIAKAERFNKRIIEKRKRIEREKRKGNDQA